MPQALGLLCAALFATHQPPAEPPLALVGGIVVDVASGTAARATILLNGDRITAVGPAVAIPRNARRVDLAGRWVIPGLADSHVHLDALGASGLPTLLGFGITSVRDLGGNLDSLRRLREATESGRIPGPRIRTAGPIVENAAWLKRVKALPVPGIQQVVANRFGIATPAEAVRAADTLAALGVDLIKIRNSPDQATFDTLLAAARRHGLTVAAHQPRGAIGLAGGFRAGLATLEHLEGLDSLPDSTLTRMAGAPFWLDPTLVTSLTRAVSDSDRARAVRGGIDSLDRLVTPPLRRFWEDQQALARFDAPRAFYDAEVRQGIRETRRLVRAGVKMLAGTDLGATLVYPGLSLHQELALLVDSLGLTPAGALRAATLEPARAFGDDSLGTIAPGRRADLVVLAADPLAEIRNSRRITAVVSRGRWYEVGPGGTLSAPRPR